VTDSRAWAAQLGTLLDVLLRMGLLGKVLRTQHAAAAPAYLISRTALRLEPPPGACFCHHLRQALEKA